MGGQRHDRFWTQAPISLPGALLPMSRLLLGTSGLEHIQHQAMLVHIVAEGICMNLLLGLSCFSFGSI